MRRHYLWLAAGGLVLGCVCSSGCTVGVAPDSSPPFDFVRDEGAPDLPHIGPIDPVIVIPPDVAAAAVDDGE